MKPWEQKYSEPEKTAPKPWEQDFSAPAPTAAPAPAAQPQAPGFQQLMGSAMRKVPAGVMNAVATGDADLLGQGLADVGNAVASLNIPSYKISAKEGITEGPQSPTVGQVATSPAGPTIAAGLLVPEAAAAKFAAQFGKTGATLLSNYITGAYGYISSRLAGQSEGEARQNAILATQLGRAPSGQFLNEAAVAATKNVTASIAGETARISTDQGRLPNQKEINAAVQQGLTATGLEMGVNVAASKKVVDATKSIERRMDERHYEIFDKMRKEGIVVPPHSVQMEAGMKTTLAGGPGALDRTASIKNRVAFNRMVREDLGIGGNGYVDKDLLNNVRKDYYAPYEIISRESELAKKKLEKLRRNTITGSSEMERSIQASTIQKQMDKLEVIAGADVEKLRIARGNESDAYVKYRNGQLTRDQLDAAKKRVTDLESAIDAAAQVIGKKTLLNDLNRSRRMIAKTYRVQESLTPGGYVDPQEFGAMLKNDVMLDGKLKDIGEFALEFSGAAKAAPHVVAPAPGALGTMVGVQQVAYGNMAPAAIAGAQVFTKNPLRSYLLSEYRQNKLARQVLAPEYTRYYEGGRPAQIARYIGLQPTENKQ